MQFFSSPALERSESTIKLKVSQQPGLSFAAIDLHIPRKMAGAQTVILCVFNSSGRRIATILNQKLNGGQHRLTWHGKDESGDIQPSGIYTFYLQHGFHTETQKLLFSR